MPISIALITNRIPYSILVLGFLLILQSCSNDNEKGSHWTKIESAAGNSDSHIFTATSYEADTLFFNELQSGFSQKHKKENPERGSDSDCDNQLIIGSNMHINLFLPKSRYQSDNQILSNLIKTAYKTYLSYTADTTTQHSKMVRLPVNIMAHCGSDSIVESLIYMINGESITDITHE